MTDKQPFVLTVAVMTTAEARDLALSGAYLYARMQPITAADKPFHGASYQGALLAAESAEFVTRFLMAVPLINALTNIARSGLSIGVFKALEQVSGTKEGV